PNDTCADVSPTYRFQIGRMVCAYGHTASIVHQKRKWFINGRHHLCAERARCCIGRPEHFMTQTRNVLIVEDEEVLAENLQTHLQRCGWNVRIAPTGKLAVIAARDFRPALIL